MKFNYFRKLSLSSSSASLKKKQQQQKYILIVATPLKVKPLDLSQPK